MENLTTTRNHHAYDIWLTCDFRGNITHIDRDSASILEYTAEEVLGNKVYDTIYTNDKFYVAQIHLNIMITKLPETLICRRVTKTGNVIAVKSCWIIQENSGEIIIYEKIINFSNSNDINIILNKDFSFCSVSDTFTDITHYDMKTLGELKLFDLWSSEDKFEIARKATEMATQSKVSFTHYILSKEGKAIQLKGIAFNRGNFIMISEKLI